MKIYLASSWRNPFQPEILAMLRAAGHEVYDFKNPKPGDTGFAWSQIEPDWVNWDAARFCLALMHPIAESGFQNDWQAMLAADAGVLLLPSGRSAHIEAGYFVGAGKPLFVLMLGDNEPELMYKMSSQMFWNPDALLDALRDWQQPDSQDILDELRSDERFYMQTQPAPATTPTTAPAYAVNPLTPEQQARLDRDFKYHPPKGDQTARYEAIRAKQRELAELIMRATPPSREQSTALTHLENAGFYANAAIARNE